VQVVTKKENGMRCIGEARGTWGQSVAECERAQVSAAECERAQVSAAECERA
jgi:hypothetical protein